MDLTATIMLGTHSANRVPPQAYFFGASVWRQLSKKETRPSLLILYLSLAPSMSLHPPQVPAR